MHNCGAHCRGCDTCFSSTRTFDAHRAGDFGKHNRRCLDPDKVSKLVGRPGQCKVSEAKTRKNRTIYGSPDRET